MTAAQPLMLNLVTEAGDVIASKEAAGRDKDLAALPYLRELRRQIEEAG